MNALEVALVSLLYHHPHNVERIRAILRADPELASDQLLNSALWQSKLAETEAIRVILDIRKRYSTTTTTTTLLLSQLTCSDFLHCNGAPVSDAQAMLLIDYGAQLVDIDAIASADMHAGVVFHYYMRQRCLLARLAARRAAFVALYRHKGWPRDLAQLVAQQPMELSEWQ